MITVIQQPSRQRALLWALGLSLMVHGLGYLFIRTAPVFGLVYSLQGIEFVEEDFDQRILITFNKKLNYPSGYTGFNLPTKTLSAAEIAKLEKERLARLERARQRELAKARAAQRRQEVAQAKQVSEQKAQVEAARENLGKQLAANEPSAIQTKNEAGENLAQVMPPTKSDIPGGFGKINTAPIKAQVQRLYDAKQEGKLVMPDGKLKVGVSGTINKDGTLSNYKIITPSGIEEIDQAAMAILQAVSASRALGPLHEITSLSMILTIDERAELSVVGFTPNEQAALNIVNLANAALLYAKIKKSDDPASMVMLNHLKVFRTGQRVQATISMPRQKATDTLAQTMEKKKT